MKPGRESSTELKSGEDIVISDATIQKLMVTGELTPAVYSLEQNYPNPFNPLTTISFSIPSSGFTSIKVYGILGKEVATLVNEERPAGNYEVNFDAASLSSGTYFYRLNAESLLK